MVPAVAFDSLNEALSTAFLLGFGSSRTQGRGADAVDQWLCKGALIRDSQAIPSSEELGKWKIGLKRTTGKIKFTRSSPAPPVEK
ncbi:hypothetical protein EV1_043702 [Malus domestica]